MTFTVAGCACALTESERGNQIRAKQTAGQFAYVAADDKSTWALKTKPCASRFDFQTCVYFHVG